MGWIGRILKGNSERSRVAVAIQSNERKSLAERKLETQEKIAAVAQEVGEAVKQFKQTTRVGRYYLYIIIVLMVAIYGVFMGYAVYKNGGFSKFADNAINAEATSRRFVCLNERYNVTFRSMGEALQFRSLFPDVNCTYHEVD
jgi:hypothetical protein